MWTQHRQLFAASWQARVLTFAAANSPKARPGAYTWFPPAGGGLAHHHEQQKLLERNAKLRGSWSRGPEAGFSKNRLAKNAALLHFLRVLIDWTAMKSCEPPICQYIYLNNSMPARPWPEEEPQKNKPGTAKWIPLDTFRRCIPRQRHKGGFGMNYIEQLNAFFHQKEQDALSSRAQCLYFNLLGLNNRYRWAAWFSASCLLLEGMGLSRNQLAQARTELMQKGYLCYENRAQPNGPISSGGSCGPVPDEFGPQGGAQTKTQTETQPQRSTAPFKNKTKKTRETKGARATEPSVAEVKAFVAKSGSEVDPELFTTYYQARGWQAGGQPIRSLAGDDKSLGPPRLALLSGPRAGGQPGAVATPSAPG